MLERLGYVSPNDALENYYKLSKISAWLIGARTYLLLLKFKQEQYGGFGKEI